MSDFHRDKHFSNDRFIQSARVKHHGLFNHGLTCYLNSVLQVLFMTRDFREAVEWYVWKNSENERIDHPLKALFDDLKQRCANTSKIKRKLGINEVHEERDAAEYFEKILNLTSPEASQIFHGDLTHKTQCSKCGKKTYANGHFWHLPLELSDSNGKHCSVVESIEHYFQTSHFDGENQMYCDQCDAKSDAIINCQMKHHPEVLTLLLKRFDFDYTSMAHVKNNCAMDVPFTLQIPKNQMYELYAVVEHFGDLRSGHYTAMIKDDERWYNFDDTSVKLLERQPFQTDKTEKYHNAYLLFYRKKTTNMQDTRKMLTNKGLPSATGHNANIKPKYDEKRMEEKTRVLFLAETGHEVDKRKVVKTRHPSLERSRKSEGAESSRRRTSSTRCSNWDEKHRNKQELDCEDAGKWKTTRHGSEIQTVDEDKKRGGVIDGKATRHPKGHDSYHDGHGEQRSGYRKQNMSTNEPRGKQGCSRVSHTNEREERREVKGEKREKRGGDEPAQSKKRKITYYKQEYDTLPKQLREINLDETELERNPQEVETEVVCCTRGAHAMITRKKRSWWWKRYFGCFSYFRRKRKNAVKQR